MTPFRNLNTTRKGEIGERIAEQWLRTRGLEVFRPTDVGQPHTVDRFLVDRRNPGKAFICDVKTKPRRHKYADTGVDLRHWHKYVGLSEQHNMPALLTFVDEMEGRVYGNFIHILDHEPRWIEGKWYPSTENNGRDQIRYWHLSVMETFGVLSPEDIETLRALSTRNSEYDRAYDIQARQLRLL